MHSRSLQSLFAISALVSGIAAHLVGSDAQTGTTKSPNVVTVVVRSTITTCPTPSLPPVCSDVTESESPSGSLGSTLTTGTEATLSGTGSSTSIVSSVSTGSSVSSNPSASGTDSSSSTGSLSGTSSLSGTGTLSGTLSGTGTASPSGSTGLSSTTCSTESSSLSGSTGSTSVASSTSVTTSSSATGSTSTVTSSSTSASSTGSSSGTSASSTGSSSSASASSTSSSSSASASSTGSSSGTSASSTGSSSSASASSTSSSSSASASSTGSSSGTSASSTGSSSSASASSTSSSSSASASSTSSSSSASASSTTSSSSASASSTSSSSSSSSSSSTSSSSTSSSITSSTTSFSSRSTSSSTTSSSSTSTSITPPVCTDFWYEKITHQGVAPFAGSDYSVYRNVKQYGAKGDGKTDDTAAINRAISDGNRCGPGCTGSSTTPALVYFPPGTYMVSSPIIDYYYTQLIGNPLCLPVLKASSNFTGKWLLDTDVYQPGGALAWGATNVFWRQVANFIVDITSVPASMSIAGIHWPSSQATSLSNIEFLSSEEEGTQHQGLFIEQGSGGYVGDLVFRGGGQAMSIGSQQFTMRNISITNAQTAIQQLWSWGWTYKGVSIDNCAVGFDFTADSVDKTITPQQYNLSVGSITILDSEIKNTPIGITYGNTEAKGPDVANNFIFENVRLDNVPTAIKDTSGTVLAGSSGTTVIDAWGRGHAYTAGGGPSTFQGAIAPNTRPAALLAGDGSTDYYQRSKPQYEELPASEFLSARSAGAHGDGSHDDTDALNSLFALAASEGKVVFLDAGMYVVTSTVHIPAGSRIFGESYPVIISSGSYFASTASPKPVVQVGKSGDKGRVEWSNTILSTRGAQAGAILLEYNLATPSGIEPSGLWDVHTRIGGFQGSEQQLAQCPTTNTTTATADNIPQGCIAAFLSVHLTPDSGGLYIENSWLWVADHDVEIGANNQQITVYAGRGLLIESNGGPLWLVGTAVEHHQLYQYQINDVNSRDGIFMGQIQTETAYYQPNPNASLPFVPNEQYHDPQWLPNSGASGWGLRVVDSLDVLVYGAGLYSFFDNYDVECSQIGQGARCQKEIFSVELGTEIRVYNLNTVGTNKMITFDGQDVASYAQNIDGFVHSIALFTLVQ